MKESNIYPELVNLKLTNKLLGTLKDFISKVNHLINWERFSKIPRSPSNSNFLRYYIDLFNITVRKQYGFILSSPSHSYLLNCLKTQMNPKSYLLFKFLCLNNQVEESILYDILNRNEINNYISEGLFIKHNSKIFLPFTVIPYQHYYYISDSSHIRENRAIYGIQPAYVGRHTFLQVDYLRRVLKNRPIPKMLEMGSGIGIVSLEMRGIALVREGAEIHNRNLEFSLANKELRNDEDVRFYHSDLFSNVTGKFDLIIFDPWQPIEDNMDFIKKFLEQAPSFLTESGNIFLVVCSRYIKGKDIVLDEISKILYKKSMVASREIIRSYYARDSKGNMDVYTSGFLWIEPLMRNKPKNYNRIIQDKINLKWAMFMGKRLFKPFKITELLHF